MSEDDKKLVISMDDLPESPPPAAPPANSYAGASVGAQVPVGAGVAAVGAGQGTGNFLSRMGTLPSTVIAGLFAGLVAWPVGEIVDSLTVNTESAVLSTALWTGALAMAFGAVFCAWDDAVSGVWSRVPQNGGIGAGVGLIGGLISGAISQAIYTSMLESVESYDDPRFYVARTIAFALVGSGVGIAMGTAQRSGKKVANGVLGGVAGGAAGGFMFQFLAVNIDGVNDVVLRMITLVIIGVGIGLGVGLVEVARRQAWIRIVSGGMTGKEFILYHEVTDLGSSPKCQVTLLKDPVISPFHCRIVDQQSRRFLQAHQGATVLVNGTPVAEHHLRMGDVIQMGNTSVQYSERAVA